MRNRTSRGQSAAPTATSSTNVTRRRFLFSLTAGGAGAAAVSALPAAAVVATAQEQTKDAATGYRETEHVRDYYRTAKL